MPRPSYSILPRARTGLAAMLSIGCAVGSFIASCAGHWGVGLTLAVLSVPLGLVGLLRSVSPEIRGGPMSVAAIFLGLLGVALAVVWLILGISVF